MVTRLIFCRTVYTVETETETMFCCWSGGIQIFKGMFQFVITSHNRDKNSNNNNNNPIYEAPKALASVALKVIVINSA